MIDTPDLIDALSRDLRPVRRLPSPGWRALTWLLLGAAMVTGIGMMEGVRHDILACLREGDFVCRTTGAMLTAIAGAFAAFQLSVPGRSRLWVLLPLPPLALWMSTVGYQCLTHWVELGPHGMKWGTTAACFAMMMLMGAPLTFAMFAMLKRAAPLHPTETLISGCLSVAALTGTAMSMFHASDATALILVGNVGVTAAYVLIGWAFGGRLLPWRREAGAFG